MRRHHTCFGVAATVPAFSIEHVLSCKNLPTLPTVAVEVLELTRNPNIPMDRISKAVQNDAALTAKVLRTVNSSYYGLSKKCSTLGRALGYLGLNTVKSVVLGFCLVDSTKSAEGGGFDLSDYWRRGLTSATAARLLSTHFGAGLDPDEAFTACLFQDIGMLACFAAMGEQYAQLLSKAPKDHGLSLGYEEDSLGFTHPEVGARLAEKWGLPEQFVAAIRFHHNSEEAPEEHRPLVRMVALSAAVACAMAPDAPPQAMAALLDTAAQWYGADAETFGGLLERIADSTQQLAREFDRDLGKRPDVARLMSEANDQLLEMRLQSEHEAESLRKTTSELEKQTITDALTGAFNRRHFDEQVETQFGAATSAGKPVSVLFCDADKFKSVNDVHGHACGDIVLKALAQRLAATLGDAGLVCRYGGEEFAVLLPGVDDQRATAIAESLRAAVSRTPIDIRAGNGKANEHTITISIGVATRDPAAPRYESAAKLVHAADEAVYTAKQNGRNRVERAVPGGAARVKDSLPAPVPQTAKGPAITAEHKPTPGGTIDILLVEDDPLASRLIVTLLSKRRDVRVTAVVTGEEALSKLARGMAPTLILADLHLPGMSGVQLVGALRAGSQTRSIPIVVLSATQDPADEKSSREAGANIFIPKQLICSDLARALSMIYGAAGVPAAAAA